MSFRIILLLLPLLVTSKTWAEESYPLITVEDGDTLVVLVDKRETRIQLIGIDAPEDVPNPKLLKDQKRTNLEANELLKFGASATQHLKSILEKEKTIRLVGDVFKKDKYGRTPALAYKNSGEMINRLMVAQGYAITNPYTKGHEALKSDLTTLQNKAQEQNLGLWEENNSVMSLWSGITSK